MWLALLRTIELPATIVVSAKEWMPTPNQSFKDALAAVGYSIVKGNDDAVVPFSELKAALKDSGVCSGMFDQAIGRELNKLGLESFDMKIDGKTLKCRKFILHNL